jgi:leader peptidase (prepilin peptidase)/N-methyltransferase
MVWLILAGTGLGPVIALIARAWDDGAAGLHAVETILLGAVAVAIGAVAAPLGGMEAWMAAMLGWTLLALAAIDLRHGILPDILTLPLLLAGLAVAATREAGLPVEQVLGAVAGYLVFAGIAFLYRRGRGREGLGLGDAKLLAAAGAWLGWALLPYVVCFAAVAALAVVGVQHFAGRAVTRHLEIRFGPYLCLGAWLVFLYDAGRFGF